MRRLGLFGWFVVEELLTPCQYFCTWSYCSACLASYQLKHSRGPLATMARVMKERIGLEVSRILQFRTPKWGKQTQRYLIWAVQFCLKVRAGVHPSQRLLAPHWLHSLAKASWFSWLAWVISIRGLCPCWDFLLLPLWYQTPLSTDDYLIDNPTLSTI